MAAPYSQDLRERVISIVDGGMGAYQAAPLLQVDFRTASLYEELRAIGVHPWMGAERLSAVLLTGAEAARQWFRISELSHPAS